MTTKGSAAKHRVIFLPLNKAVPVETGMTLLEAAGKAGLTVNSVCGGEGACGRCRMIVKRGKVKGGVGSVLTDEDVRKGAVLACQSAVKEDVWVEIPDETLARETIVSDADAQRFRALSPGITGRQFANAPLVSRLFLALDPPTLDDSLADAQRLQKAILKRMKVPAVHVGPTVLKKLPDLLRQHNFEVTATVGKLGNMVEITDVEGGDTSGRNCMAIVDVGTSTVVVHLVNAHDMAMLGGQACFNSQRLFGRDVLTRIISSEKKGPGPLQKAVVDDINRLIASLAAANGVSASDITAVVSAENTTMMHLLLGLPAGNIRRNPFIAVDLDPPPFRAADAGITVNPAALLYCIPAIGSWVGGDITAGILATGLHEREKVGMLIDIGTNGEIVLGNKEWLVACSASAGPALEGASVASGMVAENGAIERVYSEGPNIRYKVIGNTAPKGICGSGIIDAIAAFLDNNIINRSGKFIENSHPGLQFHDGRWQFNLVSAQEASNEKGIFITQDDIDNVITAKAAIFAATKIMLDRLKLGFSDIGDLYIAGGFGNYINLDNAVKIGLLPAMPKENVHYVGNTSVWGARIAAFSHEAYQLARDITHRTTYYDLMGSSDYVEQFKQAMFLPHTHIELFDSSE